MSASDAALSVCLRCRQPGWTGELEARPGARLLRGLNERLRAGRGAPPVRLRGVTCLSQCKRPCLVAFSGEERFTYLFGDLDPDRDADDLLACFALYLAAPDGYMPRGARPEALRAGVLGRVPPLGGAHPLVEHDDAPSRPVPLGSHAAPDAR